MRHLNFTYPQHAHTHTHVRTHTHILNPCCELKKMRQLSPLEPCLAGSGNLLPATKLRSAGHLHFGLWCVCVCVYMFLFARVWVWIVKTLWLVLFRMALYCCIFYFATKCIKHEIYCEPFYDFLLQSTWLLFGDGGIELGELRGTRPFHFEKLLPIEQIVFLTFLFWGCIIWGRNK